MCHQVLRLCAFFVLCTSSGFAAAVCENGSSIDRLSCMRNAFCPEASSVEERTACYQMITEALRNERLTGDRSVVRPKQETLKTGNSEPTPAQGVPDEVVQTESVVSEEKSKPKRRAKEKKEKRGFKLLGWAKSDKKEDYGPEWTRIVYVRRESSGAELVVLEGGEVWGEKKRNGFVTLSKGDWVKINGASQLVRRGGGSTEVEVLNCNPDEKLKGRCRGLKRFL